MSLKAHVVNGQIVLDEPMDLPEGAELLVDAHENAKMEWLRAAIEEGINSGPAEDSSMEGVLAEARARRAP